MSGRSLAQVYRRPLAWVSADPRRLRWLLDLGMGTTFVLVIARAASSDMLFHIMFVLLAIHAFALGFLSATFRLAFAIVAVTADFWLPGGISPEDFYNEWPLMFLIAAVTVLMAQRRQSTVGEYVRLYRKASDRLLTAQEDERRRFAMDLHDGVGQTLTALTLALDSAAAALPADHPARRSVERSRVMAAGALEETRELAQQLRPARLREIGLAAALRDLAAGSGLTVAVDAAPLQSVEASFDADATIGIFRVVQEALANASRHSGSTRASLTVRVGRDWVVFAIRDDGVGFVPEQTRERGLGVSGMHERADMLGGTLQVTSAPGVGTAVVLRVPAPTAGDRSAARSPRDAGGAVVAEPAGPPANGG